MPFELSMQHPATWRPPVASAAAMPDAATSDELRGLLARLRRGDERAFEVLHERLALRVYRRILAAVRGDEPAARELTQAALLQLVRRCPDVADENALLAWLWRVARNAWIDQCRRRTREAHVPLDGFDFPAQAAADGPLLAHLHQACAALPAPDGELLQAAYVDERPLADIAAEHGLTYKALQARLTRLRVKLREQLLRLIRHEP